MKLSIKEMKKRKPSLIARVILTCRYHYRNGSNYCLICRYQLMKFKLWPVTLEYLWDLKEEELLQFIGICI